MTHFRLRTQLVISTLLIICGLTGALLLIIRHTVSVETERQVRDGTEASVRAFESVQRQREQQLSRTAAMLADLPIVKAQMTTEHALTIQDASASWWKLAGSDLFILALPDRRVVAFHVTKTGLLPEVAERDLKRSIEQGEDASWWYDNGRLYEVFLRTITAGEGSNSQELGFLAIGYQVDSTVAEHLALMAGNHIALATGDKLIASTLPPKDEEAMQRRLSESNPETNPEEHEIALHTDHYAFSSVLLHGALPSPVRCYVMMPLAPVNSFMSRLNRTIFILGASAVLFGAVLFGFVARKITKPLDNLVSGVRALATGNYTYSITPEGTTEVAELSRAFAKMRGELLDSQRQQIETERIAALGRAASSISHDLRHYLAAVVANAEFLYEAEELKLDKSEIYQEIKTASTQMTDLIDSLRELAHQRSTISPEPADLEEIIRRAIEAVHARPEFRNRAITFNTDAEMDGMFDPRKLERAFFNLVLNACEASPDDESGVTVDVYSHKDSFEIRVTDDGVGVPENIRGRVFDPFVSSGKPNGTGLGLAIVSKIVSDHGGAVSVERTSENGTVMLVKLPRVVDPVASHSDSAVA
ncbi:MAG: periplasmic sensor signal transduction histidine kinase [Acidobacteriaceae bacterium]|nr:periplasmic sensor signal transduction histidine kinase [Acidobacteriaceae bacterium]